jgi:hypothetical protein
MLANHATGLSGRKGFGGLLTLVGAAILLSPCFAQTSGESVSPEPVDLPETAIPIAPHGRDVTPSFEVPDPQTEVNWLYGAVVPREVPLEPLDVHERFDLFFRGTFTTPGLYGETSILALHDQFVHGNVTSPWGPTLSGFAKRLGTREGEAVVQNSITALGDGLLGWEPRYDRCRCDGFWRRTRHALVRDFVTYDVTEKSLRPQIMPYLGAFSGAALATTWEPGNPNWKIEGYQAAVLQMAAGLGVDLIGEFGSDIARLFRGKKTVAARSTTGN